MRRLSPATRLVLASLVSAGKVASSEADTDFYFNPEDFNRVLDTGRCKISMGSVPEAGDRGAADVDTSIVDLTKVKDGSMLFTFGGSGTSASFQNAILVDADNKTTLAVGYEHNQQKNLGIALPQFPDWESGNGSLTLDSTVLQDIFVGDQAVVFFQMGWQHESGDEYGSSPLWAVVKDAVAATSIYSSLSQQGTTLSSTTEPTAVFTPTTSPLVPLSVFATSGSSSTAAAASTAPATASPSSTTGSISTQAKSSSDTNLSTGALVGIVIGGVVALLLVLLAAFLCIRKRRHSQKSQRDLDRDAQDLMTEKEARAAGTAPDTPYSEEGNNPNQLLDHGGFGMPESSAAAIVGVPRAGGESSQRGSVVYSSLRNVTTVGSGLGPTSLSGSLSGSPTDTHQSASPRDDDTHYADQGEQQQPFHRPASQATAADLVSPQSDDAAEETERSPLAPPPGGLLQDEPRARAGSGSRAGLARADTPGGKSISDYLHEDGMTADDIRRWEEEERAVEADIEQAGRTNSRTAEGR